MRYEENDNTKCCFAQKIDTIQDAQHEKRIYQDCKEQEAGQKQADKQQENKQNEKGNQKASKQVDDHAKAEARTEVKAKRDTEIVKQNKKLDFLTTFKLFNWEEEAETKLKEASMKRKQAGPDATPEQRAQLEENVRFAHKKIVMKQEK